MPWETDDSTGLLGHYIGTIESSVWTTDSQRADPNKPFLSWHTTVHDVLQDNFEGTVPESIIVNVSIGNGWTEDEDGLTVEHKDNLEMFKASSAYGKIIGLVSGKASDYGSQAVVKDGDGDYKVDFRGLGKYMADKGFDDPRSSNIWEGLTFEFRGIGFKFRGQSDDEVYQLSLPVRFLANGYEGAVTKTASTPKASKAAAKQKEAVDTVPTWQGAGADDDLSNVLNDLVNSAASHTEFARNALLLDGVKENDTLRDAVMDTGNYPS